MRVGELGQPGEVVTVRRRRWEVGNRSAQQPRGRILTGALDVSRDRAGPRYAVDVQEHQQLGPGPDRRLGARVAGPGERQPGARDVDVDGGHGRTGLRGGDVGRDPVTHADHDVTVDRHRAAPQTAPLQAQVPVPAGDRRDHGYAHGAAPGRR